MSYNSMDSKKISFFLDYPRFETKKNLFLQQKNVAKFCSTFERNLHITRYLQIQHEHILLIFFRSLKKKQSHFSKKKRLL